MGLFDRPGLTGVAERIEETLGFTVRSTREMERLSLVEQEYGVLRNEAEDLALHALDYFSGRPQELQFEARKRLAQRSRWALMQDPMAQGQALLLANFAFGRGVSPPTAKDKDVQKVINEAWTDANNEEKLTGYMAMRRLSNELLASGELFVTYYEAGGRIRVGRLDCDTVRHVVPDPEDRLRPLYYVAAERKFRWDVDNDQPAVMEEVTHEGVAKVKYWPHWRNVDDAVKERELSPDADEEPLPVIPDAKLAKGRVYHVAINQTGEQLRGNPPWAAQLRFFSAMNILTESHVAMAQAASSFVARRAMRASPNQVTKAAANVLSAAGELGSARLGRAGELGHPAPFAPGAPPPSPPGSWWSENESSKLEALNLNSGAGQMVQTRQIVAAPIAAASQFGQHYQGDASNANLASATTLELPTLMNVGAWQELSEGLLRWFTDRAIEAAVIAGRLGAGLSEEIQTPLSEMRLHEAEDRTAMADRIGKDLTYEFQMPYPGRRNLPEVASLVNDVAAAYDPQGVNIPLRKVLLGFLFKHALELDDPSAAVDECIDEANPLPMAPAVNLPVDPNAPGGGTTPPGGSGPSKTNPDPAKPSPGESGATGARRRSQAPADVAQAAYEIPEEMREAIDGLTGEAGDLFKRLAGDPAVLATLALAAGGANGNGSHG